MKTIGEIMHAPWTCQEEDPVEQCAQLMSDHATGFLPVVNGDDKLVGVLTDRDLALRVLAARRSPSLTRASEVMSRNLVTCTAEDSLESVEVRMGLEQVSRIVVVDRSLRCLGVVSLSDLAQADEGEGAMTLFRRVSAREARPARPDGRLGPELGG